jgi:hypothetical protein
MSTTTDGSVTVDRYFAAWNDTDPVDSHHHVLRFDWEILDADGGLALSGLDVARLDDDGRLLDVRGFFESAGA